MSVARQIRELRQRLGRRGRPSSQTWRLDTVTGDSCLALTTAADWKAPGTKAQGCVCQDMYRDGANPTVEVLKMLGCL